MKLALLTFLFVTNLWAKSTVLISYFDPFDQAPVNNSEQVALSLKKTLDNETLEIKLCPLKTVFEKGYAGLEDCLKNLPEKPTMVIGLGESKCDLKLELISKNFNKSIRPDNEGQMRRGKIIPEAPTFIAMRYPLPQMYCSLESEEREKLTLSYDAGSFVCNNTSFLMTHYYPDLFYGFIHVPSQHCRNLEIKNKKTVSSLATMIIAAVHFLNKEFQVPPRTPHSSNEKRLPLTKKEIIELRFSFKKEDPCLLEFFKRIQGVDGSKFWSF